MIKVLPDGSFEAATPAEAVEISRLLRTNAAANNALAAKVAKPAQKQTTLTSSAMAEIATSVSNWVIPSAIKFLSAIQDAGANGASAPTLMQAIGINDPKAFGGRSASINKLIERCGFSVSHVYEAVRNPQGRFWKGRAKLGEALTTIKSMGLI